MRLKGLKNTISQLSKIQKITGAAVFGGLFAALIIFIAMGGQDAPEPELLPPPTAPTVAPAPAPELPPEQPAAPIAAAAGDIIYFGGFDWRVLKVWGDKAKIITEYIIEHRYYHYSLEPVTWETSDIRHWLNNDFLSGFSETDRARIVKTTVINDNNQWFGTTGGDNTTDRIFLLSIEEVVRYFGDSGQLANRPHGALWISDTYNSARIARNLAGSVSWWWLRSPGSTPFIAARVFAGGYLYLVGFYAFWEGVAGGGVRPALILNLESYFDTQPGYTGKDF